MTDFNGYALAQDLVSVANAKKNLRTAMINKGFDMAGVAFVDYANLIRGFYVAAPEPVPEPAPEPTPERETYTPVDIHAGDSVTFNLSATSPTNPYREGQCKPFTLIWPEANGTDVVIALNIVNTSDTYLYLIDSTGSVVHEDDDGGGSANALLKFNYADYSAPLTVVATTYGQNNYASMTITVTAPNPVLIAEPIAEVERMGWMDALDQSPFEAMWVNSLLVNTPIIIYSESSRINEVGRCCYSNGSYYSAVDLHHSFTNADIDIDDPLVQPLGDARLFALMKRGISPEGFLFEPPSSIEPIEPIGPKHQGLPS